MTYRLHYWNRRGRGEQVRLFLRAVAQPYEDVHFSYRELSSARKEHPERYAFGSLPVLEDGDFFLPQGPTILAYLARKHGLQPSEPRAAALADAIAWGAEDLRLQYFGLWGWRSGAAQKKFVHGAWRERWLPELERVLARAGSGFFVGGALSHADVAVFDAVDAVLAFVRGAELGAAPLLATFYDAFKRRPEIAAYLQSEARPKG